MGLREVTASEKNLATKSLLKGSILIWKDVRPDFSELIAIQHLQVKLNNFATDLKYCSLEDSLKEVAAVVAGYVVKFCKKVLTVSDANIFERVRLRRETIKR